MSVAQLTDAVYRWGSFREEGNLRQIGKIVYPGAAFLGFFQEDS